MADRSIDGRRIAFERADHVADLDDDAVPAPELMSVPAQISEERWIKRAVSATRADCLDLAQDHRAEESSLTAGADEQDHLRRATVGNGEDDGRNRTEVGKRTHIRLLSASGYRLH